MTRNYTQERTQDQLVLDHLKHHEPMTIRQIERLTAISEFDLRKSLMRLCQSKQVRKFYAGDLKEWVYERGPDGLGPEAA